MMEKYPPYQSIFAKLSYGESQMLDKAFYEEEVKRLCLAFEQQVCNYKSGSSRSMFFCLRSILLVIFAKGRPISLPFLFTSIETKKEGLHPKHN